VERPKGGGCAAQITGTEEQFGPVGTGNCRRRDVRQKEKKRNGRDSKRGEWIGGIRKGRVERGCRREKKWVKSGGRGRERVGGRRMRCKGEPMKVGGRKCDRIHLIRNVG